MSTTSNISIKANVNGPTKILFTGKSRVIPAANYQPKQTTVTQKKNNS